MISEAAKERLLRNTSIVKLTGNKNKYSTESFRARVEELHPSLDFSNTVYTNAKTKVSYVCKIHGERSTIPSNLLNGGGCKLCSTHNKLSKEDWLSKFEDCNCEQIDYSGLPEIIKSYEKVEFTCEKHGKFLQTPQGHLKSCCKKCGIDLIKKYNEDSPTGWSFSNWENTSKKSKKFDSYKVYIIKCWDEKEEFFKIGRTFMTIENRFPNSTKLPYKWELIKELEFEQAKECCEKEIELKKINKNEKYIPIKKFGGMNECFKTVTLL